MKREILFRLQSLYRDDLRVTGFRFGEGEKAACIVGALRGNEVQQLYVCARLIAALREIEKDDGIMPGKSVMIIPTAVGASMNVESRLWAPENVDVNRRFPGSEKGSTTERIA